MASGSMREVSLNDAEAICGIYNEYVRNSIATFEEIPVTASEMSERISEVARQYPWLVYELDGKVVGYTHARRWKERAAYLHSVETGTYLASEAAGRGIGSELKKAMLDRLRELGFHAVISGISLPNPASEALCRKFGFEKIAHFREVGYKFGKWIDVVYWEKILQ